VLALGDLLDDRAVAIDHHAERVFGIGLNEERRH